MKSHALLCVGVLAVLGATALTSGQTPVGTAFTYQGWLTENSYPANGPYDLQFTLFDSAGNATPIGPTLSVDDLEVVAGLFTVQLDFGSVYSGSKRWLEIAVRPGASVGAYTTLAPRQELTATPHAVNADLLDGLDSSSFLQTVPIPLVLSGDQPGGAILRATNASTVNSSKALLGEATGASGFTYGVRGSSASPTGVGVAGNVGPGATFTVNTGVCGYSESGAGTAGISVSGTGVLGSSDTDTGVWGDGPTGVHGYTSSLNGVGVRGEATMAGGTAFGVRGSANGGTGAGVYGQGFNGASSIKGYNASTGRAGDFQINNPDNTYAALYATTNGTGPAVHVDGLLQVGSNPGRSGELQLFRNGSANPVARAYTNVFGGNLDIFDELGNEVIQLWAQGPEPGGYLEIARDVGQPGFLVNGNFSNHEPLVNIAGSTRSAIFDMGASGNSSVRLPTDAISSSEILDEPGAASSSEGAASTTLDGTVQTLLSRTITCPAGGYVLVIGTCQPQVFHAGGTTDNATFGVSDAAGTFPANQDVDLQIPFSAAAGTYILPVTVHGLFSATAGAHTFYFLARESSGEVVVFDKQLSLVYLPTAYGTIQPTFAGAAQSLNDEMAPAQLAMTAEDIAAERAESIAANAARIEGELAAMKAEIEALKAQLYGRDGR